MKKILLTTFLCFFAIAFAQKPAWINDRDHYSNVQYLSGFAENVGLENPNFINALKASAKSELIESIKVSVASLKELHKSERAGIYSEDYAVITSTFANAEINGLKIEYYYDNATRTGYAFAYADKSEVKGYYKANISFIIQKIETAIYTAQQFETEGNKGKSRKTYEETMPFFEELNFAQSLLIAIEGGEPEEAQIPQSLLLKSTITQAISRLQTAIIVYVQSKEMNFEKSVQILAPKLKAELSKQGCCFTSSQPEADLLLVINASTHRGNCVNDLCFSYLDVEVSLKECKTGKEIYNNNFTDLKGGALDYERAGRKAYENGLDKIAGEIVKNLEK